jgi:hypothetical protein
MIGGMICPPVDAAASTAPANSPLYPVFFIIGIVTLPVVTVFPTDEPDTMPHSALEITATFAGPPADEPASEFASWMKKSEMPVRSRNAPKMMNTAMYLEQTLIGVERMPVFL